MANSMMIRIATFILIALATLFSIISIAGNYWYGYGSVHVGLWNACFESICRKLPDGYVKGEVHGTRAFMVLAITAYIAAIGFVVLMHIKKDLNPKILGAILVVACLLEVTALAIYTDYAKDFVKLEGFSYKWAYALGWLSAVLTVIAAVLTFVFGGRTD